ncbi:zinc finger, c4 type (two domains) domain-containing protein [Ditylenchus destructor]|uniref:Zinc finger, c4 type (Two domains) domain-containing protein n=1 Tax=Ditylenchus destructor TaxID=166010 RepID=A0AAD4MVT3_9BILA|nr:zinc finger, c4 type (two domains) domain-containing protein [Ditylenchus destructor]
MLTLIGETKYDNMPCASSSLTTENDPVDLRITKFIFDPPEKFEKPQEWKNLENTAPLSYLQNMPLTTPSSKCFKSRSRKMVMDKQKLKTGVKTEAPQKCSVCGSPTSCCHYDVPACNGCKTFFRRTLVLKKKYECKNNGKCNVVDNSEHCRACRFDRSLIVGMKPEAVALPASPDCQKFFKDVMSRKSYLLGKLNANVTVSTSKAPLEETYETQVLVSLMYVEEKLKKIRESCHWRDDSFFDIDVRELIHGNQNELSQADKYVLKEEPAWTPTHNPHLDVEMQKRMLERWPPFLTLDLFLSVEAAKTFPFFHQLEYFDQEVLLKHVALANAVLVQAFYSYQLNADTFTMPNGFSPIQSTFWKRCVLDDVNRERVSTLKQLIYCRVMEPFFRVGLTMEEFVLLKAIIYSNSAIPELSTHGKGLLEKQAEFYSKILLKHLQTHMGPLRGARKYSDIISLVDCVFRSAQNQREFHIYLQTVFRFRRSCPKFMDFLMYG